MSDRIICEKCGTEMIPLDPDRPVGMICPKCSWGWTTSYIDPIMDDTTNYTIFLLKGTAVSKETIKAVAEAVGINWLEAKKLLETAPVDIYSGKATDVKVILKFLTAHDIQYKVEPSFPYCEDKRTKQDSIDACQ